MHIYIHKYIYAYIYTKERDRYEYMYIYTQSVAILAQYSDPICQLQDLRSQMSAPRSQIFQISQVSDQKFPNVTCCIGSQDLGDLRSQMSSLRSQISDVFTQILDLDIRAQGKTLIPGLFTQTFGFTSQTPFHTPHRCFMEVTRHYAVRLLITCRQCSFS